MQHHVEVLNFHIDSDDGPDEATIIVKPPIKIGPYFLSAVLGSDPRATGLEHLVTTDEATYLIGQATYAEEPELYDPERTKARDRTSLLAERIQLIADDPSQAIILSYDHPFPPLGR
ncbi:MAG TPA: hypothetical protein VLI54_04935 [Bacillota bacterium]|nr:hypothetical protein [Bacillota bacterium]